VIAYQRKNYQQALDFIQKAVRINQTSPLAYQNLGNVLREQGDFDDAATAYKRAIDLKSDYYEAYYHLGLVLKKLNRLDEGDVSYLMQGLRYPGISLQYKYNILVGFAYVIESSREWNQRLFETCIVPATQEAFARKDDLLPYYLNFLTAISFAQQPHTHAQWRICHEKLNAMFISAGQEIRKKLPECVMPSPEMNPPIVGFILDFGLGAGSGEIFMLNLLRGLSRLDPKPIIPVVYAMENVSPEMASVCSDIGIPPVCLSLDRGDLIAEPDFLKRIMHLRTRIQQDKVSAVVYPGTIEGFPCFAASIGLAPVQIYLSLGFRSILIPDIDGYVTTGSPVKSKKILEGRWWRTASISHTDIYPTAKKSEMVTLDETVLRIRREKFSKYEVILGTIARPQKIENPLFIAALARILKSNRNAVFLWFGPKELENVRYMMAGQGISDRCLFQGWVDVKIYAKLIDIHMDAFPFPTALAMYDSMSAGTAGVWMEKDSGIGVGSNVMPLLRGEVGTRQEQQEAQEIFRHPETGECLALCANSSDMYIAHVQRLIDDVSFRKALGDAGRRFMVRFCHDPRIAAKAYAAHFLEIIAAKTKAVPCFTTLEKP